MLEEIFSCLPSDKFPRQSDQACSSALIPRLKSTIEEEIKTEDKKSMAIPQSQLLSSTCTMNYIQSQMKEDNFPENWTGAK